MTETPLQWLFLDLNSYFASVEQELRPELRGRPIAIVPVVAPTTCCIAVSYEARSYGIRTGTSVADAKQLCPQIDLVEARPKVYVEMHHRILQAIEQCLPVHAVLSCDEFVCQLAGTQRDAERAVKLAGEIKQRIRRQVGSTLRCSIGIGPNRLLAKIAAGMKKPDGLSLIQTEHLPNLLYGLDLRDVPGIGSRMERRLQSSGILTMRQLWALSSEQMSAVWGSVLGDRLWLELRGTDLEDAPERPAQTISRQHILPPKLRMRDGCRQTALKLLYDCARRMRKRELWAGGLGLAIYHLDHSYVFEAHCPIPPSQDFLTLQQYFLPLWEGSPDQKPASLCVFLTGLEASPTLGLFPANGSNARVAACRVMEEVNRRFGGDALYPASLHHARNAAPTRISFGPPPPLEEF